MFSWLCDYQQKMESMMYCPTYLNFLHVFINVTPTGSLKERIGKFFKVDSQKISVPFNFLKCVKYQWLILSYK